jgi:hypothetical protein
MKRGKTRPFTAPRPSKPVQTGHRKDNAEWGKRMERQLAQIKKNQISVVANDNSPNVGTENNGKGVQLNSQTEADEIARFGEVLRCSSDSEGDEEPITQSLLLLSKTKETIAKTNEETKGNTEFIGVKVARDFGKQGVFLGEIVALEYDSGDEAKNHPFYVVRYTDGDQEDYDGKELSRALELYYKTTQKGSGLGLPVNDCSSEQSDDENETISSGSDDEETYIPSPEVQKGHFLLI